MLPKAILRRSVLTSGACKTWGRVISVNRKEERNHVPLFRNWGRAAPPPPLLLLLPAALCQRRPCWKTKTPSLPRALARILSLSSSPHVLAAMPRAYPVGCRSGHGAWPVVRKRHQGGTRRRTPERVVVQRTSLGENPNEKKTFAPFWSVKRCRLTAPPL